jgi:HEAT repeat protein
VLLPYLAHARGPQRELLARVMAEVADSSMTDELLVLAGDASAEVRAAAARALSRADPWIAVPPLAQLAQDAEWFVRLRAVVALGSFAGNDVIAVLIRALGDRQRQVRQRAAWSLMRARNTMARVLQKVVDSGDNYGLQAVVAELERSGRYAEVWEGIKRQSGPEAKRLASALQAARDGLALEAVQPTERKEEVGVP